MHNWNDKAYNGSTVNAPLEILCSRISARDNDTSEANLKVLEQQLLKREGVKTAKSGVREVVSVSAGGFKRDHIERVSRRYYYLDPWVQVSINRQ